MVEKTAVVINHSGEYQNTFFSYTEIYLMFYFQKLPFVSVRNELTRMMKELICSVLLLCGIIGTEIPNPSNIPFHVTCTT